MILTCPECATRYEIDSANFPAAGRKVRCKKCSHVWFQPGEQGVAAPEPVIEPPQPEISEPVHVPEPEPEVESEPEPVRAWRGTVAESESFESEPVAAARAPRPRKSALGSIAVFFGWIALVGVILVIGWSAMTYHQEVATVWPQSSSLFKRMGMSVNTRGIEFIDVNHASQTEDGQPVLLISGKLKNVGTRVLKIPPIRVTLVDSAAHPIHGWNFAPGARQLTPGQTVPFRVRLSNPPAGARRVDVRFAGAAE
ncbi:MAG TPA: DUF3426 domain-containing protein [Rhizomicrobium sp.]